MKQRVLLFFLFVLFCLGLVGCAAVYPQEELAVKGGFDGTYYIYSDKVNVYLRYSGKEDYLRAPLKYIAAHMHQSFTATSCQNSSLYVSMTSSF